MAARAMEPCLRGRYACAARLLVFFLLGLCLWDSRRGGQLPRLRGQHGRRHLQEEEQAVEPQIMTKAQGALIPPRNASEQGGTEIFFGLVPPGYELVVAAEHLQPTVEDCSAACRELEQCNVFWWCGQEAGCESRTHNLSSPYGGCQLVNQELSMAGTGRPAVTVPAAGFTGGAPLRNEAPPVAGYDVYPGLGFWYRYDYSCPKDFPNSVSQPGSCGLKGSPAELVALCDVDPNCRMMTYFANGRDYLAGRSVTLFKGAPGLVVNISDANFNHNSVLYVKRAAPPTVLPPPSPGTVAGAGVGGGGLSAGAIAGILMAATCGAAAVAAIAFILLRRQRRQRRAQASALEASTASSLDPWAKWAAEPAGQSGLAAELAAARPTKPPDTPPPAPPPTAMSGLSAMPLASSYAGSMAWEPACIPPPTLAGAPPAPPPAGVPIPGGGARQGPPSSSLSSELSHHSPSSTDPILARLPGDSWQRSLVDPQRIHFCRAPDGSYMVLGRGAFSTVYRVVVDGAEPYAAKVLLLGDDPKAQEDFLKEAAMLRQLRHKNIILFAGMCVAQSTGIILMELMEGGDLLARLREDLKSGRPREWGWYGRGRTAVLEVARALDYLHSHGLVHFDTKSKNVLIDGAGTAKLADVGYTRALRHTHHTLSNHHTPGTWDYMAPELLLGRKVRASADIYSFGVLLWEVCRGEYPTRGCMDPLRAPLECPQGVVELQLACTQEQPELRPSAGEVLRRLEELCTAAGAAAED